MEDITTSGEAAQRLGKKRKSQSMGVKKKERNPETLK